MGAYSVALALGLAVSAPWWSFRMVTSGRYRKGLAQRLGWPGRDAIRRPSGQRLLWVHAVSVGEVLAVSEVIRMLRERSPETGLVLSTTTATGQALARQRFPDLPVLYLPLDFALTVRRVLRAVRPEMVVLVESELWPRLLWECRRTQVPVVVVNARISDRSFRRAWLARWVWRPVLRMVTQFFAQGPETADRLRSLGVLPGRIQVPGNLKFDVREPTRTEMVETVRRRLPAGARVLLCGSTLDGEEELLLSAWPAIAARVPGAFLVLAPRHPQRFSTVVRLLVQHGLRVRLASTLTRSDAPLHSEEVLLLDTIGDLAAMYTLAAAAFVGGSLVDAGGHNPLEPARFGVPLAIGRSVYNFREIAHDLEVARAVRFVDGNSLVASLSELLAGGDEVRGMGKRGQEMFAARTGATGRTVAALLDMLARRRQPGPTHA